MDEKEKVERLWQVDFNTPNADPAKTWRENHIAFVVCEDTMQALVLVHWYHKDAVVTKINPVGPTHGPRVHVYVGASAELPDIKEA